MPDHIMVVLANAAPGRDDEYNSWYNESHIPEVLAVPGFVAARRYRLSDAQGVGMPEPTHRYLVVFEIEGDAASAMERLQAEVASGAIVAPDVVDHESVTPWIFTPITERVTSGNVQRSAPPSTA
jgi:hypothetical protein